jgi:hypothetical protein
MLDFAAPGAEGYVELSYPRNPTLRCVSCQASAPLRAVPHEKRIASQAPPFADRDDELRRADCVRTPHAEQPESKSARSDAMRGLIFVKGTALARFPLEWNRSSDKKSRQTNTLERILVAKVCQLLRNAL